MCGRRPIRAGGNIFEPGSCFCQGWSQDHLAEIARTDQSNPAFPILLSVIPAKAGIQFYFILGTVPLFIPFRGAIATINLNSINMFKISPFSVEMTLLAVFQRSQGYKEYFRHWGS